MLRAEAVRDRILRPTDQDPPIAAQVTVIAPLDALRHPRAVPARVAEINGQPITAGHLRQLLESVDAPCPGGLQPPTGGRLRYALTDPDGALRAVLTGREHHRGRNA